jgi:hypothetical protein
MKVLYFTLLALVLSSSSHAQELVTGSYSCRIVGSKSVSDGRGSSVRFESATLQVASDGAVSMSSRATFTVRGRKPRVETLAVKGRGALSNYDENDGDGSASTSFRVTPAKRVIYRGKALSGSLTATFSSQETILGAVKTAEAGIRTQVGSFRFVCKGRTVAPVDPDPEQPGITVNGNFSGLYSGDESGTWSMNVSSRNSTFTVNSPSLGVGTGPCTFSSSTNFTCTVTHSFLGTSNITGNFSSSTAVSGSWQTTGETSGTFSGTKD